MELTKKQKCWSEGIFFCSFWVCFEFLARNCKYSREGGFIVRQVVRLWITRGEEKKWKLVENELEKNNGSKR